MSQVRVLVGTRKGAFILASDGKRKRWDVSGPHFGGWEIYHLKGSPAVRIGCMPRSPAPGSPTDPALERRRKTWEAVGNKFAYEGTPGTHLWYDGTPRPWEFTRVWHLEPSLTDPDTVYAGIQDAALFAYGRRRADVAGAPRPAQSRLRVLLAARRRRVVLCTRSCWTRPIPNDLHRHLGGRSVPVGRRGERRGRPMNAASGPSRSRTRRPRWVTAFTASPCTARVQRAVHAEALGRHAHRRRRGVLA